MQRRIRKGLGIGFFAALALGLAAILVLGFRDDETADRARRASIALEGAAARLAERHGLELESTAAGRELAAGRYDFRGALAGGLRRSAPVYGVAELTCRTLSSDPECWRIVMLERDGEPWDPAEPEPAAKTPPDTGAKAAGSRAEDIAPSPAAPAMPGSAQERQPEAPAAAAVEAEAPSEPGAASGSPATETSAGEAAGAAPVEPSEAAPPAAIYVVTAPVVNGRAGPGTDHAIVEKVTPGMRLELRARQDDWGRFRVVGEAEGDTDPLWIWMPLVRSQSEEPEA